MAIQDKERAEIIARINALPAVARLAASDAFRLGHEEGWWLARTDPESTVSPVEHAATTNPFGAVPTLPDGHIVVSLAYTNEASTWMAKSKVIPYGPHEVGVEFKLGSGETVHGYTVKAYAGKTDATPILERPESVVPAVFFKSGGTYTVNITPELIPS